MLRKCMHDSVKYLNYTVAISCIILFVYTSRQSQNIDVVVQRFSMKRQSLANLENRKFGFYK